MNITIKSRYVRHAAIDFNWLNTFNHKADIAKLNRDGRRYGVCFNNDLNTPGPMKRWDSNNAQTINPYNPHLNKNWKPECDYYCTPCYPEKVKTKLYNIYPIGNCKRCSPCYYYEANPVGSKKITRTFNIYKSILE